MEKEQIKIIDERGTKEMLWETVGKPAYEKGLLEGRQEAGLFAIIPMSILENKTLSANAKLLYGEIMALSKKSGLCYATNEYMAEMLGLSKTSIPQIIRELSGCGLIIVDIERSEKGTYRNITISFFNEGGACPTPRGGLARQQGGALSDNKDKLEIDKLEIDNNLNQANPEGFADKPKNEINILIEKFNCVNPTYERLFRNKTERAAIENLVKKYGAEKTGQIIDSLPKYIYQKFCPRITTPNQLYNKLGELVAFISSSQKSNKGGSYDLAKINL